MSRILPALCVLALTASCATTEPEASPQPAPRDASRAGSEACAGCHEEAHRRWSGSHHALAEARVDPADPAFAGGPPVLRDAGPDGVVDWPVERVIGVAPLRQYLVPFDGGRWQVGQRAYDPAKDEWFDVFADGRQPGEWGHWTGRAMTWNSSCGPCHTTGLVQGYDPATDTFDTRWAELGVGCEGCHGPASAHAAGGPPPQRPDADTCASCHARAASLTGAFAPGEAFLDHYLPELPDEEPTWHADGQVADELFEAMAYRGSRMHEAGVGCADCHDPHDGQLRAEGDALCLDCHAPRGFVAHDRHDGAVACVDCHMPTTTYMQRHVRRDHGLHVPDPELSAQLGTPDACGVCHTDREPVLEAAARWWPGLAERPRRARGQALAALRRGEGPAPQLRVATQDPSAHWRAVATGWLGPWDDDPEVRALLRARREDPDPWMRLGAVRALAQGRQAARLPLLEASLRDPVRAVRVVAALGLQDLVAPGDPSAVDLWTWLQRDLHQPQARATLAGWLAAHGRTEEAEGLLRDVVRLDPGGSGGYAALAVVLAQQGRGGEALQVLEDAVARLPDDASLHHQLGLARVAQGDLEGARVALQRSTELAPARGRAWYNLGLLRDRLGDGPGARDALERAAALDPSSPDPVWAHATLRARSGDLAEARRLAEEALRRDPGHREARTWLEGAPR